MNTIQINEPNVANKAMSLNHSSGEDILLRLVGFALITLGVALLLYVVFQIPALIDNLAENPIHKYIVCFYPAETPIKFGETLITFPKEYLRIVAFIMLQLFLYVVINIGTSLISCGKALITITSDKEMKTLITRLQGS